MKTQIHTRGLTPINQGDTIYNKKKYNKTKDSTYIDQGGVHINHKITSMYTQSLYTTAARHVTWHTREDLVILCIIH